MTRRKLPVVRPTVAPSLDAEPAALNAVLSAAVSKARRVQEVRRGRPSAMAHGIFSQTVLARDVQTEVALVYQTHPALDLIADRRLVELYATVNTQRHRCLAAMERDGLTSTLTAYDKALSALVERLERAIYERQRQRVHDFGNRPLIDLRQYEPEDDTND